MASIVVSADRVALTPKASGSYFYSSFDCVSTTNIYGGIGMRIKAASGTIFAVQLQYSTDCTAGGNPITTTRTTTQLGWTFDGFEKMYYIQFSQFSNIHTNRITAILFEGFNAKPITLGPMAFYCGNTGSEYIVPTPTVSPAIPTATVPATTATATAFLIDKFSNPSTNALGFWHGSDDDSGLIYSNNKLTIKYTDNDYAFYTQITSSCRDMTTYNSAYLHIAYSGSNKFTISMLQHNPGCNEDISPYPETWDDVYAQRYSASTGRDIYIPLSHFNITKTRVIGFALKSFADSSGTTFSKIEIVRTVPSTFNIPSKVPTAPLVFSCTRPNSFAFAIDGRLIIFPSPGIRDITGFIFPGL
jgi:hypothetical protein